MELNTPAVRPDMSTDTVISSISSIPLELPDTGASVSQSVNSVTVQFRTCSPAFQIPNVCDSGFPPPSVAVNSMMLGA